MRLAEPFTEAELDRLRVWVRDIGVSMTALPATYLPRFLATIDAAGHSIASHRSCDPTQCEVHALGDRMLEAIDDYEHLMSLPDTEKRDG